MPSTHTRTAQAADLPPNDDAALDRLQRFGGVKLLRQMVTLFLAAAPERIAAARAACEAGDLPAAELALHSLKSSSAQLGAMGLQRLSEMGEHRVRAGSLDGLAALTDQLEQELARVRVWLASAYDEGAA